MANKLLIVESPVKAKTIAGYLSNLPDRWTVKASKGHIKDLVKRDARGGYGVYKDGEEYHGEYRSSSESRKIMNEIRALAKEADEIYLGTDDDREGEVIALHILEELKISEYRRVAFVEISKEYVLKELENPRLISGEKACAGITRRLLDRMVGFELYPIMQYDYQQRNIDSAPPGLGRVSAQALHIFVMNQIYIDSFEPESYYRISVDYEKDGVIFRAHLGIDFMEEHKDQMDAILRTLSTAQHTVVSYEPKTTELPPKQPLTTASMIYGGWYVLGMREKEVMRAAQNLKDKGYITYHRTDSFQLNESRVVEMIDYLHQELDDAYILDTQRKYKKRKGAQEGHEAIRPTSMTYDFSPEVLLERGFVANSHKKIRSSEEQKITMEEFKLYEFIWYRTLATQMTNAVYDSTQVIIDAGGNRLKAEAKRLLFDGWLKVKKEILLESERDDGGKDFHEREEIIIPQLNMMEELVPLKVKRTKLETKSPARFGVGRAIAHLGSKGIGRPSTFDEIIPGLESSGCIAIRAGMIHVLPTGVLADRWVAEMAPWLHDLSHAKSFEDALEEIEQGKRKNANDFIKLYDDLLTELKREVGYESDRISALKQHLVHETAKEKGVIAGQGVFASESKAEVFLDHHAEFADKDALGACPACFEGSIYEKEKLYGCNRFESGCRFALWKDRIAKTMDTFHKEYDEAYVTSLVRSALHGEPQEVLKLRTKQQWEFNARFVIQFHDRWGWSLGPEQLPQRKLPPELALDGESPEPQDTGGMPSEAIPSAPVQDVPTAAQPVTVTIDPVPEKDEYQQADYRQALQWFLAEEVDNGVYLALLNDLDAPDAAIDAAQSIIDLDDLRGRAYRTGEKEVSLILAELDDEPAKKVVGDWQGRVGGQAKMAKAAAGDSPRTLRKQVEEGVSIEN